MRFAFLRLKAVCKTGIESPKNGAVLTRTHKENLKTAMKMSENLIPISNFFLDYQDQAYY